MTNKSILPIITISCGLFFSTATLATDNNNALTKPTTTKPTKASTPAQNKTTGKPVIFKSKQEALKKRKFNPQINPQKKTTTPAPNTYTPYTPTPTSQYGDQYHD